MSELARYEAAERAIAAAEAVDEVLEIRSQAEAWRAYAKQAQNKDLEIKAARIRFRAEKRLGEMLISAKAAGQVSRGQPPKAQKNSAETEEFSGEEPISRVTLREAGIDHKLSSRAQRLAAMDAAEFEHALDRHGEEMRAGQGRVAMDLLKVGAEEKGRAHRRNVAAVLSEQSAELPSGPLVPAVYLDPPWRRQGGIGDRAYENHYPTMTWPEILAYLRQVRERLLPDSWAFMWIPRPHLLALVEIELEVTVVETGEVTLAKVMMPLAWACAQALAMDSYSTCFVWTKTDEEHPDVSGSGLIAFDQDELLLLFKRGQGLPKPAGSEKFGSNHRERPREHSRKPDHYRRMIATMVGCDAEGRPLPVLELFARVDAEHPLPPGWLAAGNQAAAADVTVSPATAIEEGGGFPVAAAPQFAEETGALGVSDNTTGGAPNADGAPLAISSFAAGMPSDAGETVTAAANATSDGASVAAAVADVVAIPDQVVDDRAPYDADDVVAIDQLAGSEWLQPAELDALELSELEQLMILSDFCHPKRATMQDVLGASWEKREMAYQSGGQWQLREAGWSRLHALRDAVTAPPVVALTEPYRAPQMSLFDCPAPEIVDGALQTRLPIDDDELAEQLALIAVDAGGTIDGQMARHLCGKDYLHATTKALKVTDLGRAFLAQLVGPASVQQQGDAR
ncbi:N6-adenosine-specific RNA methylase IME4 [Bradyrhizobium japonicum]|uniref:N6-adenosine-specific RNA methylase IME4 n=1 Tax=Bradyrhizobium japonicum TaxID=375 RepID=A0ABV2RYB9_BRAJP